MAQWFALAKLPAVEGQGPFLMANGAGAAAVGAGLLGAEGIGLLCEQDGEGALGEPGGGGAGDVLHGLAIDVGAGPLVAEGTAGDDFAPLGGEITDFLEFLGRELASRHGLSCLVLARMKGYAFLLPLYRSAPCWTKLFMASSWSASGRMEALGPHPSALATVNRSSSSTAASPASDRPAGIALRLAELRCRP
jgi:hypothetical protein